MSAVELLTAVIASQRCVGPYTYCISMYGRIEENHNTTTAREQSK